MERHEAAAVATRDEALREVEVLKARLAGHEEILEALRAGAGARAGTGAAAEPKPRKGCVAEGGTSPADDDDPAMEGGTPGFEPQELPMGLSPQPRVS